MGFADAAIMDTKDLVFVPEYRQFCEDNLCGNYNLVPACPPACGTVEEMQAKALKYEKALVLQTVLKDPIMDPVLFKQAKHAQNILTEQLARQMQEAGKEDILIMSAGPYKNCSCMSAYSVDAQKMADAVGMVCCVINEFNLIILPTGIISYAFFVCNILNILFRIKSNFWLLFTHHYSARCFGMNLPQSVL